MSLTSLRPAQPALHTLRHLGGRAAGRLLGLPPATTDYTVRRVAVPMRDGVELVADHYAPATSAPAGGPAAEVSQRVQRRLRRAK